MTDGPPLVLALAQMMAAARDQGVPPEVAASARQRILDTVGICAAASPLATSRAVTAFAAASGGTPEAQAVGVPAALPAQMAALVNGTLAHSLDFDDTHLPSVLHPSASVVPACLAVAELTGSARPRAAGRHRSRAGGLRPAGYGRLRRRAAQLCLLRPGPARYLDVRDDRGRRGRGHAARPGHRGDRACDERGA